MQCLVRLVAKKIIVLDMPTQRTAMYHIRVKNQSITFRLKNFAIAVNTCYLSRRKEYRIEARFWQRRVADRPWF